MHFTYRLRVAVIAAVAVFCGAERAQSQPVAFQNATATFSQTYVGDWSPAKAINGTEADALGWAVGYDAFGPVNFNGIADPATAVFETVNNLDAIGSAIQFELRFNFTAPAFHTLGRFRISVTSDDRSTFADGLSTGGDVIANWTPLSPYSLTTSSGAAISKLGDNSVLVGGLNPETDVYRVYANLPISGVTGVRLEALADVSLPWDGPGRQPLNGNFVLTEITAQLVPETGDIAPAFGVFLMVAAAICRKAKKHSASAKGSV